MKVSFFGVSVRTETLLVMPKIPLDRVKIKSYDSHKQKGAVMVSDKRIIFKCPEKLFNRLVVEADKEGVTWTANT